MRKTIGCLVLICAASGVFLFTGSSAVPERIRSAAESKPWVTDPPPEVSAFEVGEFFDGLARQEWIDAELRRLEDERIALERAAAEAAALRKTPARGTVGECTGFVIPAYIIERESGGDPSAYNPSGAYGCAQTLLSHYSGGACAGLDPYTIEGQRECVYRLSDGGTNLNPWAATR